MQASVDKSFIPGLIRNGKRLKQNPSQSIAGSTSRDSDNEDDDGASQISAATFRTTGLTQAQLDRERGRPRPIPSRPSHLSTSYIPEQPTAATSSAPREPDYATFSLSSDDDNDLVEIVSMPSNPFVSQLSRRTKRLAS